MSGCFFLKHGVQVSQSPNHDRPAELCCCETGVGEQSARCSIPRPEMTLHTFKGQLKSYLFHIWWVDEQKRHSPPPVGLCGVSVIPAPHIKLLMDLLTYYQLCRTTLWTLRAHITRSLSAIVYSQLAAATLHKRKTLSISIHDWAPVRYSSNWLRIDFTHWRSLFGFLTTVGY